MEAEASKLKPTNQHQQRSPPLSDCSSHCCARLLPTGQREGSIEGNPRAGSGSLQNRQGAHRGAGPEKNAARQGLPRPPRVAAGGRGHADGHHFRTHHGSQQDGLTHSTCLCARPVPPARRVSNGLWSPWKSSHSLMWHVTSSLRAHLYWWTCTPEVARIHTPLSHNFKIF